MPEYDEQALATAALSQAQQRSLRFLDAGGGTRAVPFSFTPCPVSRADMALMRSAAILLGQLTQAIAADADLIQEVHAPLASGDPFFAELLRSHEHLTQRPGELLREPLLLQRSDFMIDATRGPQLVECNSIAAGMAPFGEQTGLLQQQLHKAYPAVYQRHCAAGGPSHGTPAENRAAANMAAAIAAAATRIANALGDDGPLRFLMVVQEAEDNVFDQRLLEDELRALGLLTVRRTFRELHGQLGSGPNDSLELQGEGTVHVAYLRAGYQFHDYVALDLDTQRCCDALQDTRLFMERHRVALNATVAQQLATSKRMQLHLTRGGSALLQELGFTAEQSTLLQSVMTEVREVDADTLPLLQSRGTADWVLKNQGEGGGHCLFDDDIITALERLNPSDYGAWVLMRRLRPAVRDTPALLVRETGASAVDDLISETGIFTAHLGALPLPTLDEQTGYIGYLVRSKPASVVEGGVHSGQGVLDSLLLID
ncbi:MAG: glutathione synthase [Halioglobus sp.]